MKTQLKAAVVMLITVLSTSSMYAQTPAPPPPPPPPPQVQPGDIAPPSPPPPPPKVEKPLQEIAAFQGKIVKMSVNDDYVYDGFYMLNGTDSMLVRFPPHMGSEITKTAGTGSNVTVNGVLAVSPSGQKEIHMISIIANGNTITETPPSLTIMQAADVIASGSGKISNLQVSRDGNVTGYMLDNNIILRIPPNAGAQLETLVQPGIQVSYTGNKKVAGNGEVMESNHTIIHCKTLTINGRQYLVQ